MSGASELQIRVRARVGALRLEVDLEAGPGTLVVVGPNGAGKSSLLSVVLGALAVEQGRIGVGGSVLLDTAAALDVPIEHRRLGYVPQDYALFPHLCVRENVEFALGSAAPRRSKPERARRASALLHELGLEALTERDTRGLSGGEKQRVALARALAATPRALLLDEPLAALDVRSRDEVRAFLAAYLEKLALPTLLVTHDAADARALGQRIAVLEDGRITQVGSWHELCAQPRSAFVEKLVST